MNKFDAVFYDLDGTLIDSVPVILESFKETYIRVLGKCDRTTEDLKSYIGKPLAETFKRHDEETAKVLFDTYLEVNCEKLRNDEVELFPNVEEGLSKLKNLGVKQAIVTSKKRVDAMTTINLKKLDKYFDDFICVEDSSKHKPDAEPILTACKRLGISDPSRVLYVGDALPDALCANNAGASFALVDWSVMPREEIVSVTPTIVIHSIDELSCII